MLKNISTNWIRILTTIVVAFVLTPFLINILGKESYGTWILIQSITGYLGLLVLGVPMASLRYFAEYVAEGDQKKMNEAIGSCALLYLLIGGVALLVGIGFFGLFEVVYLEKKISPALSFDARLAFILVVLCISTGFIANLPYAIMAAHHDFVPRNLVMIGSIFLKLALTVVLLRLKASLTFIALVHLICLAFEFFISWFVISKRYPGTLIRLGDFKWGRISPIFSFSLYVLLLNMGNQLAFQSDALVIGAFIGVDQNTFYNVANNFVIYLAEFFIAIASVIMPMATALKTKGQNEELRALFFKWSKIAMSLTTMACLYLIILGPDFIVTWIGDSSFKKPAGDVLQVLMLSCFMFLPVRGVALPILIGLGKPKLPAIAFLLSAVMNVIISIILAKPLHLLGVGLGTAIPNVLFAVVVLIIACRELNTSFWDFIDYAVYKVILGALPVFGLLLWFKHSLHVQSFPELILAGIAMVLTYGVISILFVYRKDPYLDLIGRLKGLLLYFQLRKNQQ